MKHFTNCQQVVGRPRLITARKRTQRLWQQDWTDRGANVTKTADHFVIDVNWSLLCMERCISWTDYIMHALHYTTHNFLLWALLIDSGMTQGLQNIYTHPSLSHHNSETMQNVTCPEIPNAYWEPVHLSTTIAPWFPRPWLWTWFQISVKTYQDFLITPCCTQWN